MSEGWHLGDSANPLRPWMMTPDLQPSTPSEMRYNADQAKTKHTIGRCFRVWES